MTEKAQIFRVGELGDGSLPDPWYWSVPAFRGERIHGRCRSQAEALSHVCALLSYRPMFT